MYPAKLCRHYAIAQKGSTTLHAGPSHKMGLRRPPPIWTPAAKIASSNAWDMQLSRVSCRLMRKQWKYWLGLAPVEMAGMVYAEGFPEPTAGGGTGPAGAGAGADALLASELLELGRRGLFRGMSCSCSIVHTPA